MTDLSEAVQQGYLFEFSAKKKLIEYCCFTQVERGNFLNLDLKVIRGKTMLTLEQLETAILQLSPDDFNQLLEWFFDLDDQRWDQQLENDIAAGKLDNLAQEAMAEFEAGRYRAI